MQESKTVSLARLLNRLVDLGFSYSEAQRLRRIEMTLNRWSTEQCNGTIQREGEDGDGKPVRVFLGRYGQPDTRYPIPDRETGARKQLAAIMAAHPTLWHYIQGDPRGCALYVGRKSDLKTDVNQIVQKAQSWGAHIYTVNQATAPRWAVMFGSDHSESLPGTFDDEEHAALAFLRHRKASVPARNLLPLDQYYTRGTAVCV